MRRTLFLLVIALALVPRSARADSWLHDGLCHVENGAERAISPIASFVDRFVDAHVDAQPAAAANADERDLASADASASSNAHLKKVVACLAKKAPIWTPGTDFSVSVEDLKTGARASANGDDVHVSASSAKSIWLAAALDAGIPATTLEDDAEQIASVSSNSAAADVIRRVGPNEINDFMQKAGMSDSAFNNWYAGEHATNSPHPVDGNNIFTSNDMVTLFAEIQRGQLLPGALGKTWKRWLRGTPRSGYGGWLGTRLPASAQPSMVHKAGWLPPGCCSSDAKYNDLNDVGLVKASNGHRYAVAILGAHGADYWHRQAPFEEYASCAVYRAVSNDPSIPCGRKGDPVADVCKP